MSAVVWANILLAIPFLVTFIAVPLWWTFRRPQTGADHAESHAYLRTRTAFADGLARRQSASARTAAAARTHAA